VITEPDAGAPAAEPDAGPAIPIPPPPPATATLEILARPAGARRTQGESRHRQASVMDRPAVRSSGTLLERPSRFGINRSPNLARSRQCVFTVTLIE
jgi:hypothetical protein